MISLSFSTSRLNLSRALDLSHSPVHSPLSISLDLSLFSRHLSSISLGLSPFSLSPLYFSFVFLLSLSLHLAHLSPPSSSLFSLSSSCSSLSPFSFSLLPRVRCCSALFLCSLISYIYLLTISRSPSLSTVLRARALQPISLVIFALIIRHESNLPTRFIWLIVA